METLTSFKLTIELGNSAVQTPEDVAKLLTQVAVWMARNGSWYDKPLRDENGNTVGLVTVD